MAPWPAQGNEPKAPDRNKTSDNRTVDNLKSKSEPPDDKKLVKGISKDDQVRIIYIYTYYNVTMLLQPLPFGR